MADLQSKPILLRGLTVPEVRDAVRRAKELRLTRNAFFCLAIRRALYGDHARSDDPQDQGEDLTTLIAKHGYARAIAIEEARGRQRNAPENDGEAT